MIKPRMTKLPMQKTLKFSDKKNKIFIKFKKPLKFTVVT